MKQVAVSGILAIALSIGGVQSAVAQTSTFMLVPNIAGDSTELQHVRWIEVFSITQSFNSATKANACTVLVAKGLDRSGPLLWAAAATGKIFPEIRIDILKTTGDNAPRFYELILTNATISAITSMPNSFAEQLTVTGTSATLRYFPQNPDGSITPPIESTVTCK